MPSRRKYTYSRDVAMAKKRDTDEFQRIYRTELTPEWDDELADAEASTYASAEHGPTPVPPWVITSDEARQYERGFLKTGKEADVHLVERRLGDEVNMVAAKRYRKLEDRLFRNDARYRAGRRTGESRLDKAIAQGNQAGMAFRAQQWLTTEFETLSRLWAHGVSVPYPIQQYGNEVMLELIGTEEEVAPRLVNTRPTKAEAEAWWEQLRAAMLTMTRLGVVHGDLSPYNVLVDRGRLVIIDFPQAVDPFTHPEGLALLERDVRNVATWFRSHGVPADPEVFYEELRDEAVR